MDLKNIKYTYVAKDIARQATTITDRASATYIADGEVVVTNLAGVPVTSVASTYKENAVKIVQRRGDSLISSPAISFKNINSYKVSPYVVPVKQVTFLGYNGTSGNLENNVLIPGTDYIVTLRRLDTLRNTTDSYYHNKSVQWYNELATNGQYRLADGLIVQFNANFNSDHLVDNYVIFERISSSPASAIGGSSTLKVISGSKTVIASSASHGLVVGDHVRIGGTATITPVYKVTNVNGTFITLDTPYQGDSATVANSNCLKLTAPTTSDWGIKMTGNDKTHVPGRWYYDIFAFEVSLTNFNDTEVVTTSKAFKGCGAYGEVADCEWETIGNEGQSAEYNLPPMNKTLYADPTKDYNWIVLTAFNNQHASIHSRPESPFELLIAVPTGNTQGDDAGSGKASGVATALDNWLTTMTGVTYNEDVKLT